MPGTIHQLLPRTEYDFTNLSTSSTQTIPIVKALDISQWSEAVALLRVHSNDIAGDGGTAQIGLRIEEVLPSREEPQTEFVGSNNTETLFDSASTAKLIKIVPTWDLGSIRVLVKGSMDSSATSDVRATISVDLSLKARL